MTRDDIIRMAQQVKAEGFAPVGIRPEVIRLCELLAAAEREACAQVCEEAEARAEELWDKFSYPEDQGMASGARQCAAAIRARVQDPMPLFDDWNCPPCNQNCDQGRRCPNARVNR